MTIPGYSYTPQTLTGHIHLGVVPYSGGSPSGFGSYGEPPYKYVHIEERLPIHNAMAQITRGWLGTPFFHTLKDANKAPITFKDIRYKLRVNQQQLDELDHMYKSLVYLVDTFHCLDNQDHTPFVKLMYFDDLSYDGHVDQKLNFSNVTIAFIDANTVATP